MTASDTCPSCYGGVQPGAVFCSLCGNRVRRDEATSVPPEANAARSPGSRITDALRKATRGTYQIEQELGEGPLGPLYLARDQVLDRPVVLKVLSPWLQSNASKLKRFLDEARLISTLRHESLITLHEVGKAGDLHFLVMDHLEGPNLDHVLRTRRALPLPEVEDILRQVGQALDYIHEAPRRLVHRDVKPSNITLLEEQGRAILMDFGISEVDNSGGEITSTGLVLGSPEYMSPEQCRGLPASAESDQYALGAVAYAMLAGRPPFIGSFYQVLLAHQTEDFVPVSRVRADCPPRLASAVERMLAKDPRHRWPTLDAALRAAGLLGGDDPVEPSVVESSRAPEVSAPPPDPAIPHAPEPDGQGEVPHVAAPPVGDHATPWDRDTDQEDDAGVPDAAALFFEPTGAPERPLPLPDAPPPPGAEAGGMGTPGDEGVGSDAPGSETPGSDAPGSETPAMAEEWFGAEEPVRAQEPLGEEVRSLSAAAEDEDSTDSGPFLDDAAAADSMAPFSQALPSAAAYDRALRRPAAPPRRKRRRWARLLLLLLVAGGAGWGVWGLFDSPSPFGEGTVAQRPGEAGPLGDFAMPPSDPGAGAFRGIDPRMEDDGMPTPGAVAGLVDPPTPGGGAGGVAGGASGTGAGPDARGPGATGGGVGAAPPATPSSTPPATPPPSTATQPEPRTEPVQPPAQTQPPPQVAPAPEPEPEEPVVAALGGLEMNIRPWAEVYVNGVPRGRFQTRIELELPEGTHFVRLVNPNLSPFDTTVVVRGGQTTILNKVLQPDNDR